MRQREEALVVQLHTKPTQAAPERALFLETVVDLAGTDKKLSQAIEGVVDSSRYFVLRVEKGKRHTYVGIGFRERDAAFSFKAGMQDFQRSVDRSRLAARRAAAGEGGAGGDDAAATDDGGAAAALADMRLETGKKIHVTLGHGRDGKPRQRKAGAGSAAAAAPGGLLLTPPPKSGATCNTTSAPALAVPAVVAPAGAVPVAAAPAEDEEIDEEWGDFS